jgi:hypothetical protein
VPPFRGRVGENGIRKTDRGEEGEWSFQVAALGWEWGIDEPSLLAKRGADKGKPVRFCALRCLDIAASVTSVCSAIIFSYFPYGAFLGQRSPSVTVHSRSTAF